MKQFAAVDRETVSGRKGFSCFVSSFAAVLGYASNVRLTRPNCVWMWDRAYLNTALSDGVRGYANGCICLESCGLTTAHLRLTWVMTCGLIESELRIGKPLNIGKSAGSRVFASLGCAAFGGKRSGRHHTKLPLCLCIRPSTASEAFLRPNGFPGCNSG